ncbi:MAG: NAD(+)--dinitrogen-reductase ADP-D-ribosyltransferase [Rhodocyclaceae bacterium]|jgi:NAD+--dinitrogen-reductase ADP-D-ribosyltransferase|nr:NAD(+)--dinitrogen-reductase ADP-D-ribosyltransferase [Rhodocyclaceae bacterium]
MPAPFLPRLPRHARLPINRCNLPADILGSLTFQEHPSPLRLDGVAELHRELFAGLQALPDAPERARRFEDYLTMHFRLDRPEEMGLTPSARRARGKANWLKVLRGWLFNPDGQEAAVLKGWVESRFGLLPRHHREALRQPGDEAWRRYEEDRAAGLYGTSALEAQLDLLYAFTQFEFLHTGALGRLTLYRGTNHPEAYERLSDDPDSPVLLFNNLSSFSTSRERADEFGDTVLAVEVPTAKVLFHGGLFPGRFRGEEEYLVIGGLYAARGL